MGRRRPLCRCCKSQDHGHGCLFASHISPAKQTGCLHSLQTPLSLVKRSHRGLFARPAGTVSHGFVSSSVHCRLIGAVLCACMFTARVACCIPLSPKSPILKPCVVDHVPGLEELASQGVISPSLSSLPAPLTKKRAI